MVEGTHAGNWYVLVFGLPQPEATMLFASGISLRPLDARLDVFDLAAVGAVGFREWAALEPIIPYCTCEIESAKDADVPPGFDTLNRAWLAGALLVLRGFTLASGVACSAYSSESVQSLVPATPGTGHRSRPRADAHGQTFCLFAVVCLTCT